MAVKAVRPKQLAGACAFVWLATAFAAAAYAQPDTDLIEDGRAIAQAQCATCHGVDAALKSPRPDAPPLRLIGRQYSFPVLEEELIQGIKLGHPDMPRFEFAPRGVDALIVYLRSIQDQDRARPHRKP